MSEEEESEAVLVAQADAIAATARTGLATREARAQLGDLSRKIARSGGRRDDPPRQVLIRLGDRWSSLIMLLLNIAPLRHATLRRLLDVYDSDFISPRMLSACLRKLERDGFIARTVISSRPVHVEYSLTSMGRELAAMAERVSSWAAAHEQQITENWRRFDEEHNEPA